MQTDVFEKVKEAIARISIDSKGVIIAHYNDDGFGVMMTGSALELAFLGKMIDVDVVKNVKKIVEYDDEN